MPYTVKNPPDWLKNLPKGAIVMGVRIYNSTYRTLTGAESTREDKARIAAWSAIKQKYYKADDGKWKLREKQITDPYEILEMVSAGGEKASWFRIDLEPSPYIYRRQAMVTFRESEGIRLEWGKNDGTGEWDLITVWFDDSIYTRTAAEKMIKKFGDKMKDARYQPKSFAGAFSSKTFTSEVLDAKEQTVYGELYVPWDTDTKGHYASDYDVEWSLEDFMARHGRGETKGVGIEHKVFEDTGDVVQGFVAREGDKTFTPGAAVLGIRCTDTTWQKVQDGKLNGLSLSGKWDMIPIVPADETSKGIWQISNIRIEEPSLVLKGATRRDFKMFKSVDDKPNGEEESKAEGLHIDATAAKANAEVVIGKKSASDEWWLTRGGGKTMNKMDLKTAKAAVARVLADVFGEKSELEKISGDDLGDAKATAGIINSLIDSVNGLHGAMKSINENLETIKSMVEKGAGGKQEPGAEGKEGEGKEGEHKEGEGKEGEHKEGEHKEGEGKEPVAEEEAAKSIKALDIVHSFREVGGMLAEINKRLDGVEKAKGVSMQELLKSVADKKSSDGGDGEMVYSTLLGTHIPAETVKAYRESSRPAKKN